MNKLKSNGPLRGKLVDKRKNKDATATKRTPKGRKSPHLTWEFKPKLRNMGAILHAIDPSVEVEMYNQWVHQWKLEIQSLIRNHGFTVGAQRINLVRGYLIALVEGRNPENPGWLATSKVNGVPSCIHEKFIEYIIDFLRASRSGNTQPEKYQVINTIMNIHRMHEGLVDPNLETITEKPMSIDLEFLREFSDFVETYISKSKQSKKFPVYEPTKVNLEEYRFNVSKNGPNGMPKVESAHVESLKLVQDKLYHPFSRLAEELKMDELLSYVKLLSKTKIPDKRKESIPLDKVHLRKLVSIPDKGFKTRIVAICDFWTQLLLEPVRDHVQAVTAHLFKRDHRMNQNHGVESMIQFQKDCIDEKSFGKKVLNIKYLKCYDISSWTDRFHRDLQKIVMKSLFDGRVAEQWSQLTVHCDWYLPSRRCHIKYGQGQGMGTNGSFDIATLTDHLFIHFMYKREGMMDEFPYCPYGKVGDDLWIYDPTDSYQKYCEKINLPINISKSKVPCELGSVAEFCSRTALNGTDVSRISPNVVNRSQDFRSIPQLLSVLNLRNVNLTPSSVPTLQHTLKNSEEKYLDKLQPWLISAVVMNKFLTNSSSPYGFLTADYLVQNNWVSGDLTTKIIHDQECLMRIAIGNSIISILNSAKVIEDRVRSIRQVENGSISDEGMKLVYDTNLFSTDGNIICQICENVKFSTRDMIIESGKPDCPKCVLLPWEIIPLVRLKTLKKAVTEDLIAAHSLEGDRIEDILEFSRLLNRIAVRVDFNGAHIDYDARKVYNRQFAIVKFLDKSEYPFTSLRLDNDSQLNAINSILSYDELPVEWNKKYLPKLYVNSDI